jgi:Flp pilus assembly protein TadB
MAELRALLGALTVGLTVLVLFGVPVLLMTLVTRWLTRNDQPRRTITQADLRRALEEVERHDAS